MQAIRVHEFGLDAPMRLEEVEDPAPGPGEIVIRVGAAGVNPVDMSIRSGVPPYRNYVKLPYLPGMEAAGEVVALGEGAENFRLGQRVFGRCPKGGYAERVHLEAATAVELPDDYGYPEGAAIPIAFYTAWNGLVLKAGAGAGETVLVQGGAGGVGMGAIQLAKALGCRVITTVSTQEKAGFARRMGADEIIRYREEDFAERCLELTGGRGVDVILELAACDNFDKDLDALCVNGRLVVVGSGTGKGPEATFRVPAVLAKDARILGLTARHLIPHLPEVVRRFEPLLKENKFQVHVDRAFPFAEAEDAQKLVLSGNFLGKVVLTP